MASFYVASFRKYQGVKEHRAHYELLIVCTSRNGLQQILWSFTRMRGDLPKDIKRPDY